MGTVPGDGEALLAALLERVGLDDATLREQILASEPGRQLANDIARTSAAETLRVLSEYLTGSVSPDVRAALHRAGVDGGNGSALALMAGPASDLIKALGGPVRPADDYRQAAADAGRARRCSGLVTCHAADTGSTGRSRAGPDGRSCQSAAVPHPRTVPQADAKAKRDADE